MSGPSYSDLIRVGADTLRQAGLADPVRDARRLLEIAAGLSSTSLISQETDTAPAINKARYDDLIARRANRVPFAHLKGEAEFYGLTLKSDNRALIPRGDSEIVVDLALSLIPEGIQWTIADLGTGTGALLAALITNRPETHGIGVEASEDAYELANENIIRMGLIGRTRLLNLTWRKWTEWNMCDLIISNPPYIERAVLSELESEVRDHDPIMALDGGPDGLSAYREIISLGTEHMKPDAHLVLEIGYDQKQAVSDLLHAAGFADLTHRADFGGNDRAIAARKT